MGSFLSPAAQYVLPPRGGWKVGGLRGLTALLGAGGRAQRDGPWFKDVIRKGGSRL